MIIESIVTTINLDGTPHIVPMGPEFQSGFHEFTLKPFAGSATLDNLKRRRSGVVHFIDDAMLFVRGVLHRWDVMPPLRLADHAAAPMLREFLRAIEFEVRFIDETANRAVLNCVKLQEHIGRPPRGCNRALNAIVEASILVSRINLLPRGQIDNAWPEFEKIVAKTGNASDQAAMTMLTEHLRLTEFKQDNPDVGK